MSGRYTAESATVAPPVYLSVNVYRARGGWYVVRRTMRAGGRAPRTVASSDERLLCSDDQSMARAVRLAADVLAEWATAEGA